MREPRVASAQEQTHFLSCAMSMEVETEGEDSRVSSPGVEPTPAPVSSSHFSIERILGLNPSTSSRSRSESPPPRILRPTPSFLPVSAAELSQELTPPGLQVITSPSGLAYTPYPALLYSGWLAAKHPSQLFGLQGEFMYKNLQLLQILFIKSSFFLIIVF
jgi:hypothetical protein